MVKTGGNIPVDVPDIITILVFPHFAKSHTPSFEATVVVPRKDLARQTARFDLYLPYFLEYFFRFPKKIVSGFGFGVPG
jgi:hypothetical protein